MKAAGTMTLEQILGRRKAAGRVFAELIGSVSETLRVEDHEGRLLLGAPATDSESSPRMPVSVENEVVGFVAGESASTDSLAKTLSWVASREAILKQLGAEVLNAYREINLIHNFAETLATLLDIAAIAEACVTQAASLVESSLCCFLLWSDEAEHFEAIARSPVSGSEPEVYAHGVAAGVGLVGAIAAQGNAEIVNAVAEDSRCSEADLGFQSAIFVPLKIQGRSRGMVAIGSRSAVTYSAADLKLMTTLGLQAAVAIENALLHASTLEAAKTEAVLLNILPAGVARELQQTGSVQPVDYDDVTVCFTDFVGFSNATMNMAAEEVIAILNRYFTAFDRIVERYGLEKLKTIGDSYMFVSGLPERRASNPVDAVLAAMEMVETVREFCGAEGCGWQVRIGLHTGPVVAGVVGISKYAFDIWGETVNVASRMESCGAPNRVNISERTCNRVKDFVTTEPRGKVRTKEGRELEMFFVGGVPEDLIDDRTADLPPRFAEQYLTQFGAAARSFPRHLLAMAETTTSTM